MFLTTFLIGQWTHTPIPTASFSGQTIIITGSNTGIGLSAARYFALLGAAHIILAVRNTTAGEAAANAIRNAPDTSSTPHLPDAVTCKVSVWELDLADYASVIAFSERCDRELERVDVLVENAGVLATGFEMTEPWEGLRMERCVAVNVVGTMLLAVLMLAVLRKGRGKGEAPRLCIVSSEVHELTELPQRKEEKILDACNDERRNEMGDRSVLFLSLCSPLSLFPSSLTQYNPTKSSSITNLLPTQLQRNQTPASLPRPGPCLPSSSKQLLLPPNHPQLPYPHTLPLRSRPRLWVLLRGLPLDLRQTDRGGREGDCGRGGEGEGKPRGVFVVWEGQGVSDSSFSRSSRCPCFGAPFSPMTNGLIYIIADPPNSSSAKKGNRHRSGYSGK